MKKAFPPSPLPHAVGFVSLFSSLLRARAGSTSQEVRHG